MPEVKSDLVHLVALNSTQLNALLIEPESPSLIPAYKLASGLIDQPVQNAIRVKCQQMEGKTGIEQLWSTYWLVYALDTQLGVGLIGFKGHPDESGYVEVGYGISPQYRRRGYALAALNLLTEWAFTHAECICVSARTTNNPTSDRLLEKAGFFRIGNSGNETHWVKFETAAGISSAVTFTQIGIIHTPFQQAAGTPIQARLSAGAQGTIVLQPQYMAGLKDLEGFSHLILLYVFNRAKPAQMLVRPFLDPQTRGVFSTRAPTRPNPLGLSVIRLLDVHANTLRIADVDILNGTPLLDIKPYVPQFDSPTNVRIGWLTDQVGHTGDTRDDGRFL